MSLHTFWIVVITLGAVCAGVLDVSGQAGLPNFSGTWVYDQKESKARRAAKEYRAGNEIVIEHSGAEFKIERRNRLDQTVVEKNLFFTDGRGEKFFRPSLGGQVETVSKTVWEGPDLVRQYSYSLYMLVAVPTDAKSKTQAGLVGVVERYGLSVDASILTISTTVKVDPPSTSAFGHVSRKSVTSTQHVYRRKL